jgi:hypothetical protein
MPLNGTRREATADPLHALAPLTGFNLVIVDEHTPKSVLKDLYDRQVTIEVAKTGRPHGRSRTHTCAPPSARRGDRVGVRPREHEGVLPLILSCSRDPLCCFSCRG